MDVWSILTEKNSSINTTYVQHNCPTYLVPEYASINTYFHSSPGIHPDFYHLSTNLDHSNPALTLMTPYQEPQYEQGELVSCCQTLAHLGVQNRNSLPTSNFQEVNTGKSQCSLVT